MSVVRRTFGHRNEPSMRALRWFVDVKHGECTIGELSKFLTGGTRAGAALSVSGFFLRQQWATADDNGNTRKGTNGHPYLHDTILRVTPAGLFWRDYIDHEKERLLFDRLATHARIRALEMALAPLLACHEEIKKRGFVGNTVPNRTQCAIAAEVMNPRYDSVLYPWTPLPRVNKVRR